MAASRGINRGKGAVETHPGVWGCPCTQGQGAGLEHAAETGAGTFPTLQPMTWEVAGQKGTEGTTRTGQRERSFVSHPAWSRARPWLDLAGPALQTGAGPAR